MSITLLDLLSCALAVVVILLIIALNSGKGYAVELEQPVFIKIEIYGRPRPAYNQTEQSYYYIETDSTVYPATLTEIQGEEQIRWLLPPSHDTRRNDFRSLFTFSLNEAAIHSNRDPGFSRYPARMQEMMVSFAQRDGRTGIIASFVKPNGEFYRFCVEMINGNYPRRSRRRCTGDLTNRTEFLLEYNKKVSLTLTDEQNQSTQLFMSY